MPPSLCLFVPVTDFIFKTLFLKKVFIFDGSSLLHRLFSGCGEWGLPLVSGGPRCDGSLVAEHRLDGAWAPVVVASSLWGAGAVVVALGLSCSTARRTFLVQALNPRLPQWQADSLPLRHQGGPIFMNLTSYEIGAI